jgi:hypothetical protein
MREWSPLLGKAKDLFHASVSKTGRALAHSPGQLAQALGVRKKNAEDLSSLA